MTLKDAFQASMEEVKPSEELRKQTIIRMQRPVEAKKRSLFHLPYVRFAALAMCCVVIAVCAVVLHPDDTKLVVEPAETTTATDGTQQTTAAVNDHPQDEPGQTTVRSDITDQNGTRPPDATDANGSQTAPPYPGTDTPGGWVTGTQPPVTQGTGTQVTGTVVPGTVVPGTMLPGTTAPETNTPGGVPGTDAPYVTQVTVPADTTVSYAPHTTVSYAPHTTALTDKPAVTATSTAAGTTGIGGGSVMTQSDCTTNDQDVTDSAGALLTTTWGTQTITLARVPALSTGAAPESEARKEETTLDALSYLYGLSLRERLGGMWNSNAPHHRYYSDRMDYGACLEYGNMSSWSDRNTSGASISVRLNAEPQYGLRISLDDANRVYIGNSSFAFGIYEPVYQSNGTLAELQIFCAKLQRYDPVFGTFTHADVVVKGVTLNTFLSFMTDLTT